MPSRKGKRISEFYTKHSTTEQIRNIKLDTNRPDKGAVYGISIYNKYNITRYQVKNDMRKALEPILRDRIKREYSDKIKKFARDETKEKFISEKVDNAIEKQWKEYLYRDKLINNGQYDEFRVNDYRNKYLDTLKDNIDSKLYSYLKNLPTNEFDKLVSRPNFDKRNPYKYNLPTLGFFYPTEGVVSIEKELTEEIMNALKERGITIDDDVKVALKEKEEHFITTVKKSLSSSYRELIDEDDDSDTMLASVFDAMEEKRIDIEQKGNKYLKVSKKGYQYIPFVGSTRPGTKHKSFMDSYITYIKSPHNDL